MKSGGVANLDLLRGQGGGHQAVTAAPDARGKRSTMSGFAQRGAVILRLPPDVRGQRSTMNRFAERDAVIVRLSPDAQRGHGGRARRRRLPFRFPMLPMEPDKNRGDPVNA